MRLRAIYTHYFEFPCVFWHKYSGSSWVISWRKSHWIIFTIFLFLLIKSLHLKFIFFQLNNSISIEENYPDFQIIPLNWFYPNIIQLSKHRRFSPWSKFYQTYSSTHPCFQSSSWHPQISFQYDFHISNLKSPLQTNYSRVSLDFTIMWGPYGFHSWDNHIAKLFSYGLHQVKRFLLFYIPLTSIL